MEQPLLTIGAFARAVGLTPSALRYYDECGLLLPAEVDDSTGYRYYTPELAQRAQAVVRLREAGLSIDAMRTALDGTIDDRRRVLQEVLAEQEALAARRVEVLESLLEEPRAVTGADQVRCSGPELAAAIRQARVAADSEPGSALSGVLLDAQAGTLDVVATNRYWMVVRTLPVETTARFRVVLSLPDAERLAALLDRQEQVVTAVQDRTLCVGAHRVDGRDVPYPAHRMLLDGLPPTPTRVVLPRAELLDAVQATGQAEVDIQVEARVEGAVDDHIEGGGTEGLRIGDRLVAGVVDGPSLRLRLGSALTRRALSCALGPEVILRLTGETRPVRIESPYQQGFLALLMPIGDVDR